MATVPTPQAMDLLKNPQLPSSQFCKNLTRNARSSASSATSSCTFRLVAATRINRRRKYRRTRTVFLRKGMRIVFIVDDNLIGNKRAIKPVLREVRGMAQRQRLSARVQAREAFVGLMRRRMN